MDSKALASAIDTLVLIGKSQAKILRVGDVDIEGLKSMAIEVVVNRKSLGCVIDGLITESEFSNLILAHFQTKICSDACIPEPREIPDYEHLKVAISQLIQTNAVRK